MSSTGKLFISTVPAKQMARELEICSAMINELNRLLYEERAKSEALAAQLHAAKASARTERRKRQRKAAKLRAKISELNDRADEFERYSYELSHVVEEEKERADEFADDYANVLRRYQFRREECDILRARCEEREAEIAEMRRHRAAEYDAAAAARDEAYIKGANRDELMALMEALPSGALLPVGPCLNPEEEDDASAGDRALNILKKNDPLKFYLGGKKHMRKFLLRWRWHHNCLPGNEPTPVPGWGGEGGAGEATAAEDNIAAGEGDTTFGVFNCNCCSHDDADELDE